MSHVLEILSVRVTTFFCSQGINKSCCYNFGSWVSNFCLWEWIKHYFDSFKQKVEEPLSGQEGPNIFWIWINISKLIIIYSTGWRWKSYRISTLVHKSTSISCYSYTKYTIAAVSTSSVLCKSHRCLDVILFRICVSFTNGICSC